MYIFFCLHWYQYIIKTLHFLFSLFAFLTWLNFSTCIIGIMKEWDLQVVRLKMVLLHASVHKQNPKSWPQLSIPIANPLQDLSGPRATQISKKQSPTRSCSDTKWTAYSVCSGVGCVRFIYLILKPGRLWASKIWSHSQPCFKISWWISLTLIFIS